MEHTLEKINIVKNIIEQYEKKTYQIIGAAMEVHKTLGSGFLEAVYSDALKYEFSEKMIPFQREVSISITYKNQPLAHQYIADYVCFNDVIVELKAQKELSSIHEAQLLNYLKAAHKNVGLLINFGEEKLRYKRIINAYSKDPYNP